MARPLPPLSSLPPLPPLPDDLAVRLEEAVYVAVGFGVLAIQQAQVRRREIERLVGRVWRDLQASGPDADDGPVAGR